MDAVIFLAIIFVILPGLFTLGILNTKNVLPLKQRFASLSTALIPLGLMFWVAFSLSFVLTNASYIIAALSDPLGLGWNLFGTANTAWQPMLDLKRRADSAGRSAPSLARALAGAEAIFGADLPADPRFLDAVTAALEALLTKGARATLAHY